MSIKKYTICVFSQQNLIMCSNSLPEMSDIHFFQSTLHFKANDIMILEIEPVLVSNLPAQFNAVPIRTALNNLNDEHRHKVVKAKSLLQWFKSHRYCGQCGQLTHLKTDEWAMECHACQRAYYPRLTPCIITLIHDGPRLLLGRQRHYLPGVYSCIAGFIEPGETAEMTLHREIYEETNVKVSNIAYFGSQPWPFPDNLMLGFFAEYESGDINCNDNELEDLKWFDYRALPPLPSPMSIAYHLIHTYCNQVKDLNYE